MSTRQGTRSSSRAFAVWSISIVALLFVAPAFAPRADAHIYWSTRSGNIARANLDGTGVNRRFLSFPNAPSAFRPHDIAISAGHIYWANWSVFIGRARIDGTHAQLKFIPIKGFAPGYLATSASHIYWTGMAFEEPNVIGRANLDGTAVDNTFIESETSPFHVALAGSHLYWTTPTHAIVRANLNGKSIRPRFITSNRGQPGGIAAAGGHIYWTGLAHSSTNPDEDSLLGWIGRANLDGKGVRWIAAGSEESSPTDVAVVP